MVPTAFGGCISPAVARVTVSAFPALPRAMWNGNVRGSLCFGCARFWAMQRGLFIGNRRYMPNVSTVITKQGASLVQ